MMVRYLLAAIAVSGLLTVAWPAAAAQPPTLSGSAPTSAHGPGIIAFTYNIQVPADLDAAALSTHQAALLPANATSVTLDGAAVAASQITVTGGDLTIALGVVPAGAHTVRFTARVPATPSAVTESSADLTYSQGGVQQDVLHSDPVHIDLNEPDIDVFSDPQPVPVQPVGTGTPNGWDLQVRNIGFGAPPTTLHITLPSGLDMPTRDEPCCTATGDPLPCTRKTPAEIECQLGLLTHAQFPVDVSLGFTATAAAIPGTTASITVTATPTEGVDHDLSNNTLTIPIKFTGFAHLVGRATTPNTTITVGHTAVLTVTVHNDGPQPAEGTEAIVSLDDFALEGHFLFTSFDGKHLFGEPIEDTVAEWSIGTLAPAATVTAHLTVRAVSAGTGRITVHANSSAGDVQCNRKTCDPNALTLTAVAAKPATTPTPTPTPTATPTATTPRAAASSGDELAPTGATPEQLAWLGTALIAAGAVLIRQNRPRTTRPDRRPR